MRGATRDARLLEQSRPISVTRRAAGRGRRPDGPEPRPRTGAAPKRAATPPLRVPREGEKDGGKRERRAVDASVIQGLRLYALAVSERTMRTKVQVRGAARARYGPERAAHQGRAGALIAVSRFRPNPEPPGSARPRISTTPQPPPIQGHAGTESPTPRVFPRCRIAIPEKVERGRNTAARSTVEVALCSARQPSLLRD